MAVPIDMTYLEGLIERGAIGGPVLEVGSRDWSNKGEPGNTSTTCRTAGLSWEGCDISAGPGVDFTLDILDDHAAASIERRWETVLLFNLLEHVYDPTSALRNSLHLVKPGGLCVVVGPTVWQLHDYPADYWRPLPDFFIEFGRREGASVEDMAWLVNDRIVPVGEVREGSQRLIPSKQTSSQLYGRARAQFSRGLNRALSTVARDLHFPWVGLGVALRRPA